MQEWSLWVSKSNKFWTDLNSVILGFRLDVPEDSSELRLIFFLWKVSKVHGNFWCFLSEAIFIESKMAGGAALQRQNQQLHNKLRRLPVC